MPTTDEKQLAAETAIAGDDEAKRAAGKRAAAFAARDGVTEAEPVEAKPKSRKQTTR